MSSAPVTRRALLGATAAAGACGLPTIAEAGNPASSPDAPLFDLIARHAEAAEAADRATAAVDALVKAAAALYPPEPGALRWRRDDFIGTSLGTGLSDRIEGEEDGRCYGARAAAWLRKKPAAEWYGPGWMPTVIARWEERQQEVLQAWDAREAARAEVDEGCGLAAAERVEEGALDLVVALACEVKRRRPETLAGLRALAAWFGWQEASGQSHDDSLALLAATVSAFGGAAA